MDLETVHLTAAVRISLTEPNLVLASSQEWKVVASQAWPWLVLATGSSVLTCVVMVVTLCNNYTADLLRHGV